MEFENDFISIEDPTGAVCIYDYLEILDGDRQVSWFLAFFFTYQHGWLYSGDAVIRWQKKHFAFVVRVFVSRTPLHLLLWSLCNYFTFFFILAVDPFFKRKKINKIINFQVFDTQLCGRRHVRAFETSGSNMTVKFKADFSITGSGFKIRYYTVCKSCALMLVLYLNLPPYSRLHRWPI